MAGEEDNGNTGGKKYASFSLKPPSRYPTLSIFLNKTKCIYGEEESVLIMLRYSWLPFLSHNPCDVVRRPKRKKRDILRGGNERNQHNQYSQSTVFIPLHENFYTSPALFIPYSTDLFCQNHYMSLNSYPLSHWFPLPPHILLTKEPALRHRCYKQLPKLRTIPPEY